MLIHHLVLTAKRKSRLPLWPVEGAYLEALRRLGQTCAGTLALFALIADHAHLIALLSRRAAGRLAQSTILSLTASASTRFAKGSYIEPVETRSHMRWLLKYILQQPIKHRMPGHPALWIGSCLPDLLGARAVPGLGLRAREALPDFRSGQALEKLGLGDEPLRPASGDALRQAGVARLTRAAAAAFGEHDCLRRNATSARLARHALVKIARSVGFSSGEIAAGSGFTPRTVRRLSRRVVSRESLLVVARRVALEERVAEAKLVVALPPVVGAREERRPVEPALEARTAPMMTYRGG